MATRQRTALTAGLGVLVVVIGVLVLRAPAAQAEVGWFSYDGPPSPQVLDRLLVWNLPRGVGAVLVLLGLMVLGRLLGVLAGARSGTLGTRLGGRVIGLGALFVVGGLVAFALLGPGLGDRGGAVITISKLADRVPTLTSSWTVWAPDQTAAALVVATGLMIIVVGFGLRSRTIHEPDER